MTRPATQPDDMETAAQAARDYIAMEAGLVGDRDPAEVQAELPGQLEEILSLAGAGAGTRPEPEEWSVTEIVAHLLDTEIIYSGRYRWTLAHDRPPMVGYDPDLWNDRLHDAGEDPADLVATFAALRRANLALWHRTNPEDRARVAIHDLRGPETLELSFRLLAGHGLLHLDQMRRTLEAVQRRS